MEATLRCRNDRTGGVYSTVAKRQPEKKTSNLDKKKERNYVLLAKWKALSLLTLYDPSIAARVSERIQFFKSPLFATKLPTPLTGLFSLKMFAGSYGTVKIADWAERQNIHTQRSGIPLQYVPAKQEVKVRV